eukprot:gene12285-338_t
MSLALLAVLAVSPAAAVRYGRPEMIRLDSLPAAYRYNATGEKECNVCVQFADQAPRLASLPRALTSDRQHATRGACPQFLDQLLNIILNGGVIGSCEDLCAKIQGSNVCLPAPFHATQAASSPSHLPLLCVEKAACDLICDGVGLKEFIKAIEAADLDPIWLCEDLGECPHNNCTSSCASIVSATVDPPSGPVGTNFVYEITFSINSANVGSGEIQFGAKRDGDKENYEYEEGGLATPFPAPGTYQ